MNLNLLFGIFFLFLLPINANAQDNPNVKFGDISVKDFEVPASAVIDSNTNGVILADIGSTDFIGNKYHWFSYVYKKYARIKIINNKALDLANIKIRLFGRKENKDQLSVLKAATYNIENGRVITTELNKTDVFEDILSSYTTEIKFTLPSVKEGSIIEYSYTITSQDEYNIPSWFFQNFDYPCLYSEFKFVKPDALSYITVRYGIDSFASNKTSLVKNDHYDMNYVRVISNDLMNIWIMKDIPALTPEKFVNSPIDILDRIDFFLAEDYNGRDVKNIDAAWESVTNRLVNVNYFGAAIEKDNATNLLNTAEKITSGDQSLMDATRHLYYYVRNNFLCTPDDEIYIQSDLYNVNKKKKGNVAELNLLLTALLRQKNIPADPIILSTREYGKNPPDYPLLDKMNYVICMVRLGGDTIYLDASRPEIGFGKLPIDCYNGHARIISNKGASLYFYAKNTKEQEHTNVFIFKDEKEKLVGSFETVLGAFGSEKIRAELKSSSVKKYFGDIKSELSGEADILKTVIDSLNKPDFPVTIKFEFKVPVAGDIFYFNPVLLTAYNENPFGSEERKYPVNLSYPIDEVYTLNMEIPEGYAVDEIPRSAKVSYNGNEGFFEYLINKDENNIQLQSHIKLEETTFLAEDYKSLRDFFGFIISKYNEQIVFKQKK
ncbi:MAG TPA: DUF3857 domain-containing protein [Chitinophagaceae bacterium]|nr:DUF3857 domain-containing protein [Chitinophagaceae bacterium]